MTVSSNGSSLFPGESRDPEDRGASALVLLWAPTFVGEEKGGVIPCALQHVSDAGQTRDLQSEFSTRMRIRTPAVGPGSPLRSAGMTELKGSSLFPGERRDPEDRGALALVLLWAPTFVGEERYDVSSRARCST